jgi:hypothetical protein
VSYDLHISAREDVFSTSVVLNVAYIVASAVAIALRHAASERHHG